MDSCTVVNLCNKRDPGFGPCLLKLHVSLRQAMWPYWLDRSSATTVTNTFPLNGMILLTGAQRSKPFVEAVLRLDTGCCSAVTRPIVEI